ncbi:MAG: Lrp/AsnC family transcriptional regulator [Rhodoferax sp.]|uniref:Lrp/AsnC family transcriptional regulator n=1 Tax=Rhodoferax sp. TaxID=50421 RepID=UPI002622E3D4|nr:Lrp/AsnC family transcriptional regulator [Rhodoferax sp.]MDD5336274.1 Lrp/AsnC family transcriptional regulator [Rhodoferax sp.]
MTPPPLDRIDIRILEALQEDGRLSNVELAAKIALSPTPCLRRVKQLEQDGVIERYRAQLNRRKIGLAITAFVHINLNSHGPQAIKAFLAGVALIDEVVSCHGITGPIDFLLEVVAPSLEDYSNVTLGRLGGLPGVKALQTSFALRSTKDGHRLPLTQLA